MAIYHPLVPFATTLGGTIFAFLLLYCIILLNRISSVVDKYKNIYIYVSKNIKIIKCILIIICILSFIVDGYFLIIDTKELILYYLK